MFFNLDVTDILKDLKMMELTPSNLESIIERMLNTVYAFKIPVIYEGMEVDDLIDAYNDIKCQMEDIA